jgi:hypothetical protein
MLQLNANHQIHCLLLQLERLKVDGRLPPVLNVQIDGGPENANKLVLAVLSYLVIKHVCGLQHIVLTRLPVGHTHEDIDGIFGRISQYIVQRHVLTPHAYKLAIEGALGKGELGVPQIFDLFVVPNYGLFFSDGIDKNFGNSFKLEGAKLQYTISSVPVDPVMHPLGCKITCRKYVQQFYPEVSFGNDSLGHVKVVESVDLPEPGGDPINVLLKMPVGSLGPDNFNDDFISNFKSYMAKMRKTYGAHKVTMEELDLFQEVFPDNQDSAAWVKAHPERFYVPFAEVFAEQSSAETLPMRYLDKRKNDDQDILRGYPGETHLVAPSSSSSSSSCFSTIIIIQLLRTEIPSRGV